MHCEVDHDDCAAIPCSNGATCIDGLTNYTCECVQGFTGALCQTNIDDCSNVTCINGQCEDGVNAYRCDCEAGYNGKSGNQYYWYNI